MRRTTFAMSFSILTLFGATGMPAHAQQLRDLCPDRPGLGTPACTMDKGHVALELGIADWTRDVQDEGRTDTLIMGDALLRFGLTDRLEAQIGWTAFGHAHARDAEGGTIERKSSVGDVVLALRRNLRNPDGSGLSVAVMPYALVPTGRTTIGAGDWGAGLIVPLSFDLGHGVTLDASPQIDAAVDEDGDGRHLGIGSAVGVEIELAADWTLSEEVSLYRDDDPDGAATQVLENISLAWTQGDDSQWDIGAVIGLNRDSPDVELSIGYVRRF